ncbi:MAG TPA: radical SAM family heme chaperone HemW, partial [Candidatus Saccharimonadales bacterium]|nr:radical SAM family heme chaperone HemW [Candidatus Saccharimonadales bacterium]
MEYGLYIHLPYCRSICPYCDFVKAPLHRAEPARLLDALEREGAMALEGWSRPRTIYVGGGTPTALDPDSLRRFLAWIGRSWDVARVREWTVEANPEGLSEEKLRVLLEGGVNRLSLGLQSLEPKALRALGRIHTAEQALAALALARRAGFRNVSVDLMYGVPGETAEGFRDALATLVALRVPHLSAYPLQLEEGTPLEAKAARGSVVIAGEDQVMERYEDLVSILGRAGYRHYEVSNFALPGFHSRHNEGYWTRRPYLGLGPGAHSFDGASRWRNDESITRWFERVEAGELPRDEMRNIGAREASEEVLFLGLRRSRGLRVSRHLEPFQA